MNDIVFFLTGPTGFIGSHLRNRIISAGHQLITCNQNFEFDFHNFPKLGKAQDLDQVSRLVGNRSVVLIHCATKFDNSNLPHLKDELISANVLFPMKVLNNLLGQCDLLFINLNSYWQALNGEIGTTNNQYADSKIAFSNYLRTIRLEHFSYSEIFLFDTFGPGDRRKKLIPYLLRAAALSEAVMLNNSDQILNLLYIEDVLSGIFAVIENPNRELLYELSSTENYSIPEIVSLIREVTGVELDCTWVQKEHLVGMKEKWKIGTIPAGWNSSITVREGLVRIWKNYSTMDPV
jgi:nucleoside-diphosphate-sugar epimerase